jgi:hypothetical protein
MQLSVTQKQEIPWQSKHRLYSIMKLLIYLRSWALLEESPIVQPLKNFPAILWNPKVHNRVHKSLHWSLSWAISIQSTPSHLISLRSILILPIHLRFGLPCGLFPSSFPANILYSCYMPCPFEPPWLDHFDYAWPRVQVTKLLFMQFSSTSCHFIPLRPKYSPQHPESMFLP